MITSNECEGCDLFYICAIRPSKYKDQCPCLTCLVKMICNIECSKRIDVVHKVWDGKGAAARIVG